LAADGHISRVLLLLLKLFGHGYCFSAKYSLILNEKERARDAHYGDYETS
jgi:hypothetical protein